MNSVSLVGEGNPLAEILWKVVPVQKRFTPITHSRTNLRISVDSLVEITGWG